MIREGRNPRSLGVAVVRTWSVRYLEGWRVFWAALAPVIQACGGDVGVPQPFLNLRYVCFMVECIGSGCRTQAMHTETVNGDLRPHGVEEHAFIDAIGGDRSSGRSHRLEEGCVGHRAVSGRIKICVKPFGARWMQGHIT